jgi:hypothetical protein
MTLPPLAEVLVDEGVGKAVQCVPDFRDLFISEFGMTQNGAAFLNAKHARPEKSAMAALEGGTHGGCIAVCRGPCS